MIWKKKLTLSVFSLHSHFYSNVITLHTIASFFYLIWEQSQMAKATTTTHIKHLRKSMRKDHHYSSRKDQEYSYAMLPGFSSIQHTPHIHRVELFSSSSQSYYIYLLYFKNDDNSPAHTQNVLTKTASPISRFLYFQVFRIDGIREWHARAVAVVDCNCWKFISK